MKEIRDRRLRIIIDVTAIVGMIVILAFLALIAINQPLGY